MDAVEYIKTLRRLCKSKADCSECPLCEKFKEDGYFCIAGVSECASGYTEKAVQIVEQLTKDHPVKTRQSEMLKIFPDARIYRGVICLCPRYFLPEEARKAYCEKHNTCQECRKDYWLTEVTDDD